MLRKWAYSVNFVAFDHADILQAKLDELGNQGWELCGMLKADYYGGRYGAPCIFKRPGDVINEVDKGRL